MVSEPIITAKDDRGEPRDEVFHRSRAILLDRRSFPIIVVNLSPHGLMIRSDAPISTGEWIKVALPVVGDIDAAIRWALGGRIGCQLDHAIPAAQYHAVLSAMRA